MIKFDVLKCPDSKYFRNHKLVVRFEDLASGLLGFVAVHNDFLGPAVGGTRMFPYKSEQDALDDDLRLSEAMTYKCALAGVPHGGGKGVIIGDPKRDKSKKLLASYAEVVNNLKGKFRTGEDVGISEEDVQFMLASCKYFIGKRGWAGDPSPFAGLSTFVAIKSSVSRVLHKKSLANVRVTVKGVGKVGSSLVDLLIKEGACVTICDIDVAAVDKVKNKHPEVRVVDVDYVLQCDSEVYAPCAMGNEFTLSNVDRIKAKIICGGANNQLASREVGIALYKKGIAYIPDYIVNAGGLINVVDELEKGGYKKERVVRRIERIGKTVGNVLLLSEQQGEATNIVSDRLAERIFHLKNAKLTNFSHV